MRNRATVLMIVALFFAELTCSLESGMLYAAISDLYKHYADPVGVGWLITAFTLVSAASAAIAGRLGDLYGRRRVMLIMLLLAFLGSALSASTGRLEAIVAGRAIQGASMAILPLGFGILRESLRKEDLSLGISIIGATYAFGGGIGVVVGGAIVDHFSWHGIFVVSAVMALVSLVLAVLFVPRVSSGAVKHRIDFVGLLFAPAIAMVLYGVSEGAGNWSTGLMICLAAGLALLAVWFRYEWRHPDPLIDVRQLGKREVGLANLALAAVAMGPLLGPIVVLPLLQQPAWTGIGFGVSAMVSGLIKLPANATATLGSLFAGVAARRAGVRLILLASAALSAVGWFALVVDHSHFWFVVVVITLLIVPTGTIILTLVPQIVIEAVAEERTSESTGLSQVIRAFAKAIGTQVIAMCFAKQLVSTPQGGNYPGEAGYIAVFIVCGGLSLLCLALILLLPKGVRGVSSRPVSTPAAILDNA